MKVVGLISGGKDSVWNLHYCMQFGHEVVCLANLAPPEGVHELDSYMYQTVGHDVVAAIAAALGLPLVRRVIAGSPLGIASKSYSPKNGDEVEDLTVLLQDVLREHPVQAVSCGAILSDYQRMRVESVCARLGLQVLAFLWKQEQPRLLSQMVDSGLDARIVKVACMGLQAKHIGKSILDAAFLDYVMGLGKRWGIHVCGEGGEYETAVVDAPMFAAVVQLTSSETVAHTDGKDDVFLLQTTGMIGAPKPGGAARPPFHGLATYSSLQYYHDTFPQLPPVGVAPSADLAGKDSVGDVRPRLQGTSVDRPRKHLSRAVLRTVGPCAVTSGLDVEACGIPALDAPAAQCEALLMEVTRWLWEEHQRLLGEAIFVVVQVRDLGCFEAMNIVYGQHFAVDPPARVCIETLLPEGIHVRLRLVLSSRRCTNEVVGAESLRVQSISTWAMSCIGPYSQAFWNESLLFTAGMLGLVPHSMQLPSPEEATRALQEAADDQRTGMQHWEAELWLVLRSLRNVLEVVGCNFQRALLLHIYTAGHSGFGVVQQHVRRYMERDCPGADPIIICSEVPRLPKNAHIEINLVCYKEEGSTEKLVTASDEEFLAPSIRGRVFLTSKNLETACVCCTEFEMLEGIGMVVLDDYQVRHMVRRCMVEACAAIQLQGMCGQEGMSLEIQFAIDDDHNSVDCAAVAVAQELGILESCALACMPVLSLGTSRYVRVVAMTAAATPSVSHL